MGEQGPRRVETRGHGLTLAHGSVGARIRAVADAVLRIGGAAADADRTAGPRRHGNLSLRAARSAEELGRDHRPELRQRHRLHLRARARLLRRAARHRRQEGRPKEARQLRFLPFYTSVSVLRVLGEVQMVGSLGDTAHLE